MIVPVRIAAALKAVEPRHWVGLGASIALHLGVLLGWRPEPPTEPKPISFEIALEAPEAQARPVAKTKVVAKKSPRKLTKQRKPKTPKLAAKKKPDPAIARREPYLLDATWRGESKARPDAPALALPDARTLGLPAGIQTATVNDTLASGKPKSARAERTGDPVVAASRDSSAGLSEPGVAATVADHAPRGESGLALAAATSLAVSQALNPGASGAGAQASTAAESLAGASGSPGSDDKPGGLMASTSPQAALNAPSGAGVQAAAASGSLAAAAGAEPQGVRLTASSALGGLATLPAGAGAVSAGPQAATLAQGSQPQSTPDRSGGGAGGGLANSQPGNVRTPIEVGGRSGAMLAGTVEAGASRGQETKGRLAAATVAATALIGGPRTSASPGRADRIGESVALMPGEPGSSPRFAVTLQPVLANPPASNPYLPARAGHAGAVASGETPAGASRAFGGSGARTDGAAATTQRLAGSPVGVGAGIASGRAPGDTRSPVGILASPGQSASAAVVNAARESGRAPVVLQATRVIPVRAVRPDTEIQRLDVLAPSNYCPLPLPGHQQPDNRAPQPDRNIAEQPAYALDNPRIDYPMLANIRGVEGRVTVRVEVLSDGRPGKIWLKQSSGSGILDQNAQEQLKQWRFVPARKNGQPVPAWIDVPVLYRLGEARP